MANIKKTSVVRPTQIGSGVFDRRTGAPITTPLKGDLKSQTTEAFSFNKNNYNPADEQTAFDSNPTDASYDAPGGKFIYDSKTGKRTNLGSMVVPEFKVKKGRKPKTKDTPHKQDGSFETLNIYNPEGVPFTRKELFDKRMDLLREDNSRIPLLLEDITADLPESDPRINLKGFVKDYGDEVDYKDSQLGVKKMPNEKIAELGYLIKKRALDESGDQKGPFKVLSGLTEEFDLETIGKFYEQFLEGIGKNLKGVPNPADLGVYWCAAFVNHILTELGADTLGKRGRYKRGRATEYMTYGKNIYTRSKEKPFNFDSLQEGDIVIFDYNGNNEGDHVAFYAGKDNFGGQKKGYINVVGGNQSATYGDDDPALSEGRLYVDDYGRDLRAPKIINPSGQQSERVVGVSVKRNTYRVGNVLGVRRITYNKDAATITEDQQNRGIHNVFDHLSRLTRLGRPLPTAEFKDTTTKTYAKGGLADMNTQTQMAFALGGEAETVDPVSGNDVPPGSLPEEVRDDIDAKLSEGEYVVPADVVRYYGVKFFENLRIKAKQGLQQMDEDGRIGGEPTSEMSLPFDVSELEVEDEGGMRMAIGGLVPGYAPGGLQTSGVGSSFGGGGNFIGGFGGYNSTIAPKTTTIAPPPVATTTAAPAAMGPKIETYYRPDGTPVPITFINGKPQQSTQGLTKKNPNSMDTKETYNPLKGAKLNEFGQPINARNEVIDPSEAGKFPFGSIDGIFGTSARYERELAELAKKTDDVDQMVKQGNLASRELAKNNPSLLKRAGQVLIAFGVGSVAGPAVGIAAAQGLDTFNKNRNIADAQVMLKVFESQYTGGDINEDSRTIGYKEPKPESRDAAIKEAYDKLKTEIGTFIPKDPNMFQKIMGVLKPDVDARFAKLNLEKRSELANSYIAEAPEVQTADRSAAQVVQDKRIERAKIEWAGQPKGNPSWNQTGPTEETYKKYVNVGRQSEKITANGQVMRTQADAYNQNRADDQSAASKRAGERAAERARAEANGENGDQAVADFNASRADEIRTKYGGNKQTDSNGQDMGGTHCCTAAQARGDMTITEVKKLRAWHRKQDMFWQEGYDVWGKVIADNLVAKSKWQSDRVRDFYDHKIYGKRTIGSMYADVVIYPMSYIIGGYRVLKNTLKIKGKNYGS